MIFLVLQIRRGARVIKDWYGCTVPESITLADVYTLYSSGELDRSEALPQNSGMITCQAGKNKRELFRVSSEAPVGEVVGCLGSFIEFNIHQEAEATTDSDISDARMVTTDAFALLMKGTHAGMQ